VRLLSLSLALLLLAGCGGGKAVPPIPDPVPQATCNIEGIATSHELAPGTPGYAGDELTITVEVSGETPTDIVWDFGGGAIPFGENPMDSRQMELGLPGDYLGRVMAVDSAGLHDIFEFPYTVLPESHRIRGFNPSPAGFPGQPVRLSLNLDGEVEFATWRFASGAEPSVIEGAEPVVVLGELGEHEVAITVTLKAGPTVTRTLPFHVTPNPWAEQTRVTSSFLPLFLVTSEGAIVVVMSHFSDEFKYSTTCMFGWPEHRDQPAEWLVYPAVEGIPISLTEHQGRLAIGCMEKLGYAISDNLHPTSPDDWSAVPKVLPYISGAFKMAPRQPTGWNALVMGLSSGTWGTTDLMEPAKEDWAFSTVPAIGLRAASDFFEFDGALMLLENGEPIDVRVADPPHFDALFASTPYTLTQGEAMYQVTDDRLYALLFPSGSLTPHALAIADRAPKVLSDWHITPLDLGSPSAGRPTFLVQDELLYMGITEDFMDGDDAVTRELRLRNRPLAEPASAWIQDLVAADIGRHFLLPGSAGPIVGWLESAADSDSGEPVAVLVKKEDL